MQCGKKDIFIFFLIKKNIPKDCKNSQQHKIGKKRKIFLPDLYIHTKREIRTFVLKKIPHAF